MVLRACALLLVAGLLGGCSGDSDDGGASPYGQAGTSTPTDTTAEDTETPTSPATSPATSPPAGAQLVARASEFGPMLFDDGGQAIYLFDVEATDDPRCYGDCAEAWPPVLTDGPPVAGDRLDQALVGTTERRDGSTQVTYGGHPLYFYANEAPGEVRCHDVFLNGGSWYVVRPDGDPAPPG